jgi:hypothetical protein
MKFVCMMRQAEIWENAGKNNMQLAAEHEPSNPSNKKKMQ